MMQVRVLSSEMPAACAEQDYIRVHADADPLDDTVVLATIERITDCLKDEGATKHVKTLIARQRMPADTAIVLALSYAERKQVSVVYADSLALHAR